MTIKNIENCSIEEWQTLVNGIAVEKGWWEGFEAACAASPLHDTSDDSTVMMPEAINWIAARLLLVTGEVSEAAECLRDGDMKTRIDPETKKPEGFEVELADAVIRILDLGEALGLDIGHAMAIKTEYNRLRPYRHGGKTF